MKLMKFFAVALTFTMSVSHAIELRNIVLAEDLNDSPAILSFPCSSYLDVVFCSNQLILEKGCKNTLKISPDGLSCQALDGNFVKFATVNLKSRFEDSTMNGQFAYTLNFSNRVVLIEFTTPNGNTEYQLHVK